MDAKLIEPRSNVPFSNSMEDDNLPSNSDGSSPGNDVPAAVHNRPDGINNGSGLRAYPLPPDVNAPPGTGHNSNDEISDFGVNESIEVGHNGSAHNYGLAKNEVKQGAVDDSVAGQGFPD